MKRTSLFIFSLILVVVILTQFPKLTLISHQDQKVTDNSVLAQDLSQTEIGKTSGGDDLLSHYLWIDVSAVRDTCSDQYDVTIRYQNRGTEEEHNAQIVFYAPNYPLGDPYTYVDPLLISPPPDHIYPPGGNPLDTMVFVLPDTLRAEGETQEISFTLHILSLEQCRSLSNCAIISSDDYEPNKRCDDLMEVCPPDIVPRLYGCEFPICEGSLYQIEAIIGNTGGMDVSRDFEVCFYENNITRFPIHCETVPGLACDSTVTVSIDSVCDRVDSFVIYVVTDTENSIIEIEEGNNVDSVSCVCTTCTQGCSLSVSKTSNVIGCVNPGGIIHYSIIVSNMGLDACSGVRIVDTLPSSVTNITNVSPAPRETPGSTIDWYFEQIEGTRSRSLSFDAQVLPSVPPPVSITNCVNVECAENLNTTNNSDCVTDIICVDTCMSTLCPTLSVGSTRIDAGNPVTIEILPYTFIDSATLSVIHPGDGTIPIPIDPDSLTPNVVWTYTFTETDSCGTYTVILSTTYTIDRMVCPCEDTVPFLSYCKPLFYLDKNSTAPSDPRVIATFRLVEDSHVTIHIYNLAGELIVENFVDDDFSAGFHAENWDLTNDDGDLVASGVYYFVMEEGPINEFRQVAVLW